MTTIGQKAAADLRRPVIRGQPRRAVRARPAIDAAMPRSADRRWIGGPFWEHPRINASVLQSSVTWVRRSWRLSNKAIGNRLATSAAKHSSSGRRLASDGSAGTRTTPLSLRAGSQGPAVTRRSFVLRQIPGPSTACRPPVAGLASPPKHVRSGVDLNRGRLYPTSDE